MRQYQERTEVKERTARREQLQQEVARAAHTIAVAYWDSWKGNAAALRSALEQHRSAAACIEGNLADVLAKLQKAQQRLEGALAQAPFTTPEV